MKFRFHFSFVILILILSNSISAQNAPWHHQTLVADSIVNAFIDEVSGEIAMNHCVEMSAYNRNRPVSEYRQNYLEADYVFDKAKAFKFDRVEFEYFKADSIWDGEVGELWEVSPRKNRKIADYDNMTAVLARGSQTTDVTAELIYVGNGAFDADYDSIDVAGKIVLGYASVGRLHYQAVQRRNAAGVISFSSSRPLESPEQIPWHSIYSREGNPTFGFNLDQFRGMELRNRLERGEKIKMRAIVKSLVQPNRHNVVWADITGSDLPDESVILCAHLFEGIVKQGANDNISGSAVLLEVGRTIQQLIQNRVIERPRRTIRFLWIPEFSGSIPWVNEHLDLIESTLVNINLDMVGLHLSKSYSRFNLERTPFSRPSYLNDVIESVMDYVNQTNWETLHNRSFTNPILAPTGSREPFYQNIDFHYGASDHVVFNDWGVGVPAVMLITWPDLWYHSSEDRPDKLDATQLKRAGFISALSAYIIAAADETIVLRMASEIYSNGLKRLGNEYQRAAEILTFRKTESLTPVFKRSQNIIQIAADLENRTLLSLLELAPKSQPISQQINFSTNSITTVIEPQLQNQLIQHYHHLCKLNGILAEFPTLSATEQKAKTIIPQPTSKVKGYFQREWINDVVEKSVRDSLTTISWRKTRELRNLIDGERDALEIKNVLDAEYEQPTEMEEVFNYLELLKRAGLITM